MRSYLSDDAALTEKPVTAVSPDAGAGRWIRQWRVENLDPTPDDPDVGDDWQLVDEPAVRNGLPADTLFPVAVSVAAIAVNLLHLVFPVVVLVVLDHVPAAAGASSLATFMAAMAGVIILASSLRLARDYFADRAAARDQYAVTVAAAIHALRARSGSSGPGALLRDVAALDATSGPNAVERKLARLDAVVVPMALVLFAALAGWLVLVPLALVAILGALAWYRMSTLHDLHRSNESSDAPFQDFLIDCVAGLATIKAMAMQMSVLRRLADLLDDRAASSRAAMSRSNEAEIGSHLLSVSLVVGTIVAGAFRVVAGDLSIGALAAAVLIAGTIAEPLLAVVNVWAHRTDAVRDRSLTSVTEELCVIEGPSHLEGCRGAVILRTLSFAYDIDDSLVLKDVDLDIAAGEIVGIRGGDGRARTALMALLRGDLDPTNGEVRIDGYRASGPQRSALDSIVAGVPQTPSLFRGTLLDNLTLFADASSHRAALDAASMVGLDEVAAHLPHGYETMISDAVAGMMPEGLAQQVAIARSLARQPLLLLLDGVDGALGPAAIVRLCEVLARLKTKTTVVLSSDDPRLLCMADRVFMLVDGRLREAGAGTLIEAAMHRQAS